jgi:Cu+-exporting ATPase
VLIKDAEALEVLQRADTLVLDKTGTLTEGKPRLTAIRQPPNTEIGENELLRLAAGLERASEHPLAAAVVRAAEERQLRPAEVRDFQAVPGKGVLGTVEGRHLVLGNAALLAEQGIADAAVNQPDNQTVLLAAVDGRFVGELLVGDPLRPTTPEAVRQLRAEGLRLVMLTGDRRSAAEVVARSLGIDEVIAEVLPDQKRGVIERLRSEGRIVAMVGDGINDAPALAQAHVGIAIGTGTDVALESAGVTLMGGDLRAVVRARRLSRATMGNIRQNLFLAFAYNVLAVPLAAFGLLSPILAGAAMSLSSLSVVGNALRLRWAAGK